MSEAATFGNQRGDRAEAPEHAPTVPNDPARPDAAAAPTTPEAQQPAPSPAAETEPVAPQRLRNRDEIAARFNRQRGEHEKEFGKVDHVPFVERQEEEARQAAEDAPPAPGAVPQERQEPQPETGAAPTKEPPAAPQTYTLKVRGKNIPVPSRDELLRLAEVEPHEAKDFSDAQLTKLAQKHVAALSYIEEGKAYRDQSRVAAPAPAGQPAGDQQQQSPSQQPKPPSIEELRQRAFATIQLEDAEKAAQAFQAYEDARDADRQARQDTQSKERDWRNAAARDVATFGEANQDIVGDPYRSDMLLMTATREMESDLRACGLTEENLRPALNNPARMTELFGHARQNGLSVRTNAQLLEAAGAKVRQAFGLAAPAAAPAQSPTPPAAQARSNEKRGLQAQPLRSGNPQPVTPPPPDIQKSRSAAVAEAQQARRGNNVRQFA